MTTNISKADQQKLVLALRGVRDVSGIMGEIGSENPENLGAVAPKYIQQLQLASKGTPFPVVQKLTKNVIITLQQIKRWQLERKLNRAVQPTIPICVSWDNVPAGGLGAQAVILAPYSGQPFRVTEIECSNALFRFPEFNIGGVDFAEPSRTRVQYNGAVGVPISSVRGLDFPTNKARDKTRIIDANWAPWVNTDFSSDATITTTPYNYGTASGSVILTLYLRASPCGKKFKADALVPVAERAAARNAIMGAAFAAGFSDGYTDESLV